MLLQFAVENYKSIGGREVLSFLAVAGEPHPKGQVVEVEGIGPVLRSVVLYGANASGKSSVVQAFEALRRIVLDGVPPGGQLPVVPNKLRGGPLSPTAFELEFVVGGRHYAYGIRATASRVAAEWLVRVDDGEDRVVFEREDTGGERPRVTLGPGLEVDEQRRTFYMFVAEGTRHEQPLMAELRARNATELTPIHDWFFMSGTMRSDEMWREPDLVELVLRWPDVRATYAKLLAEAGTGVDALRLAARSEDVQRRIDAGEPFPPEEAGVLATGTDLPVRIGFRHRSGSGNETWLGLEELSDGTRRLLRLAMIVDVASVLTVAWVDELDRSLHTQLTRFLMERLNASEGTTQFVFTTHDTNLLDAGVFGRDAIWFVEKDAEGSSHLWSLASFDKAQLEALTGRIEEGYLQGRFGAIPFIGGSKHWAWASA